MRNFSASLKNIKHVHSITVLPYTCKVYLTPSAILQNHSSKYSMYKSATEGAGRQTDGQCETNKPPKCSFAGKGGGGGKQNYVLGVKTPCSDFIFVQSIYLNLHGSFCSLAISSVDQLPNKQHNDQKRSEETVGAQGPSRRCATLLKFD